MKLRSFIKGTAIFITAATIAGCASTSSKEAYQKDLAKFKKERPAAEFVVTNDAKVDSLGKSSAIFYKECMTTYDNYATKVSKFADVKAKMDDMKDGKDVTLTPQDERNWNERTKLIESMDWEKIGKLALEAGVMSKSAADAKSSFSGFDKSTLEKISSVKKIMNQIKFSGEAMNFLMNERKQMKEQANQ